MFERELTHITLSGQSFPLLCDFAVLEKIQDKYKDLIAFEDMIFKFVLQKDKNGEAITDKKDGRVLGRFDYPDLPAVFDALHWMINEGIAYEAEAKGAPLESIPKERLLRMIDCSPLDISAAVHDEYVKCFARKNIITPPTS